MTLTPPATRGIKFSQITSGATHSLALGSDENLYAWGDNSSGQLGDGTNTLRRTPVKINKPANTSAQFIFTTIAAGDHSSLAIGSDGSLYAWGNNARGQLGDGTTENKLTPVKVPKPAGVSNGFTWTQVSTRWDHTLALGSDHNLYAWGWNGDGQLGNTNIPTGTDNSAAYSSKPVLVSRPAGITFTQLSAGRYNSFALGSDNNLYAWGSNVSGRLGDGTDIQRSTPVQVRQPAGVTFSQFSAGDTSCFAISTNGDLYAWGWNGYGRLGDGSNAEDRKTPTLISPPNGAPSGFTWVRVMIRDTHVLAIGSDGN
ncbi:MAG: chromosome condensation regulator RCC1, partial [Bifidobacteriales bacterium]|nr:chromosome condensation regulator RCC1 [Bifidobacteriales bacterium]